MCPKPLLIALTTGLLTACSLAPTQNPVPTDPAQQERHSDTLVIMLPGRAEGGESFRKRGMFDIGYAGDFDMLAVDAHMGYYRKQNLIERLHQDVVMPAREQGYENIWFLGISLGGFGSALYTREHPDMIDGLILLAPYPGDMALVEEILDAGGLDHWPRPFNEGAAGKHYERDIWHWYKSVTQTEGRPRIILGYGADDRFADVGKILGPRLPAKQIFTVSGGHNWDAWRLLWEQIVAQDLPEH